jgi:flagellar basal body-associated protein FliL
MKRIKLIVVMLVVLLAGIFIVTGCSGTKPAAKAETANTAVQGVVYTCPMHPEVISDKPGKCPKCGMMLVIKK